ncbi:hypothetical protein LPJ56_005823, partial [Coemansia sp. RSA 2599]
MSSQPTPPPVEGLPRFSSSPAPSMVYSYHQQQQQQAQSRAALPVTSYGALHISNLTNSTPATESAGSGVGNTGNHHGYHPKQVEKIASSLDEEPRKVSVTKINALLNDDSPTTSHAVSSANWFGEPEEQQQNEPPVSNEDEATGIAALALASMMGAAGRTPPMPPQQEQQQQQQKQQQQRQTQLQPPRTRPQSVSVTSDSRMHPQPHYQHSSGPLPPPSVPTSSMSAFSPSQQPMQYHAHGSPMVGSPPQPPLASHHLQTRPSSVGPSVSYGHMSPSMHAASPKRIIPPSGLAAGQQGGPMRQRKPSAPVPMHMPSSSQPSIASSNGPPLPYISLPPPPPSSSSSSNVSQPPVASNAVGAGYHGYHAHGSGPMVGGDGARITTLPHPGMAQSVSRRIGYPPPPPPNTVGQQQRNMPAAYVENPY